MSKSYFDIELETFEYEWTIKKISLILKRCKREKMSIKSDSFFSGGNGVDKWHLVCYIHPRPSPGYEHIDFEFYVVCDSIGEKDKGFWLRVTRLVMKSNGEKFAHVPEQFRITADQKSRRIFTGHYMSGIPQNMTALGDQFIFNCKFQKMIEIISPTRKWTIPSSVSTNCETYLAELLASEQLSDVTFMIDNEKLKAHKSILATRSPVFTAMFTHPMKEQNESEVIIDDINVNVFKEMLRYIYTNKAHNLENIAKELLYAADKYGLEELKELCGISIWKEITVENSVEAFLFADRHDLKSLSESIGNFMKKHIHDVIKTTGYESVERDHPKIAYMILRKSLEQFPSNVQQ